MSNPRPTRPLGWVTSAVLSAGLVAATPPPKSEAPAPNPTKAPPGAPSSNKAKGSVLPSKEAASPTPKTSSGETEAPSPQPAGARFVAPAKFEIDAENLKQRLRLANPTEVTVPKGKAASPGTEAQRRATRAARARVERLRAAAEAQAVLEGRPLTPEYQLAAERHARRMAEIDRVLFIARQQGDEETVERANALFQQERARHAAWLRIYRASVGPASKKEGDR